VVTTTEKRLLIGDKMGEKVAGDGKKGVGKPFCKRGKNIATRLDFGKRRVTGRH